MAFIGDTVTITMEYRNPSGSVLIDPDNLVFSVYERFSKDPIFTTPLSSSNRVSLGTYSIDYTIPDGNTKEIVVEMKGTLNGKPVLSRRIIPRTWV